MDVEPDAQFENGVILEIDKHDGGRRFSTRRRNKSLNTIPNWILTASMNHVPVIIMDKSENPKREMTADV